MPFISAAQAGGGNVCAFLDLIAYAEGTSRASGSASGLASQNDGYDVVVEGEHGPEIFTSYGRHPFDPSRPAKLIRSEPPLYSTASGRYQLLCHLWEDYRVMLQLPDFSPLSQDLIAIRQMKERGALSHLLSGNTAAAIQAHLNPTELECVIEDCSNTWASFPGNTYGQGGRTMQSLLRQWNKQCETLLG